MLFSSFNNSFHLSRSSLMSPIVLLLSIVSQSSISVFHCSSCSNRCLASNSGHISGSSILHSCLHSDVWCVFLNISFNANFLVTHQSTIQ